MAAWTASKLGQFDAIRKGATLREDLTPAQEVLEAIGALSGFSRLFRISDAGFTEDERAEATQKDHQREVLRENGYSETVRRLRIDHVRFLNVDRSKLPPDRRARAQALMNWYNRQYLTLDKAIKDAMEAKQPETAETARRELEVTVEWFSKRRYPDQLLRPSVWLLSDKPDEGDPPPLQSEHWALLSQQKVTLIEALAMLRAEATARRQKIENAAAKDSGRSPVHYVMPAYSRDYADRELRLRALFAKKRR
jgi:hypothetical protein